jgi:hypothetical protein
MVVHMILQSNLNQKDTLEDKEQLNQRDPEDIDLLNN